MKGAQIQVYIVVVMVLFSVAVLGLTVEFASGLDESARVETVPLVEKRVESAIYTMSGVKEGYTTVKMGDEYGLNRENGEVFINYSARLTLKDIEEGERIIDPPVDFSLGNEGISDRFCISKSDSNLVLNPSGC